MDVARILCVRTANAAGGVTMISDQKHFDQLQHIMMLNRDKFVTGFGIRGQLSVPSDLAFFRDRPSKFGYIFEFPTPTLPIHYDTFIGLR